MEEDLMARHTLRAPQGLASPPSPRHPRKTSGVSRTPYRPLVRYVQGLSTFGRPCEP
ncbi:hypothetical protein B0H12DRAFT_1157739 [Mycena haematopus]|nr:hypothetical protein B0H12DRAFT_1157739 [Mycena haematopus]